MAKYQVKFSCGHTQTIELFGKNKDRESKIKYFEEHGICSECYEAKKLEGCKEVEMPYKQYKSDYSNYNTKRDSYDPDEKTIIVYLPNDVEYKSEEPKKSEWKHIQININNMKRNNGNSALFGMPKSSAYCGYDFWHPARCVHGNWDCNGFVSVAYTDEWEFKLKKYGKGRYNKYEVIDEITISVEDFENAFSNMNDQACSHKVVKLNEYETHKPEQLEAVECEALEELIDG